MDNNKKYTLWSIGDSESSNQGSESINTQLDSLRLTSSWDSFQSEDENIPRGKPVLVKSHSMSQSQNKKPTSQFVLQVMQPYDCNKSSGYSSSISPSSENHILNTNPHNKQSNSANVLPIFEEKQAAQFMPNVQTPRKILQTIIVKRLFKNKKIKNDSDQWYFDFGDTNLIKSCRRGQTSDVQEALNEIVRNQKLELINHQNAAKETALSIATYQMNEILINLLLKYGAAPHTQLNMKNNVLHIAADLTTDKERKTFGYLINGIRLYQVENLWSTLTTKNIFNYDPIGILRIHLQASLNDPLTYNRIQQQINETQLLINALCKQLHFIPQHNY